MSFQDVNNGFYNALVESLGLSRQHFALLQPASPVLTTANLWNHYFNLIPPEANFIDLVLSSGSQYFDNYKALWSSLLSGAESSYENKIPQNIRDAFADFVSSRPNPPSLSQFPALFRNWAFIRYPKYANIGATAWANMLLDPIASGSARLIPYLGDPGDPTTEPPKPPIPERQPDWDEDIDSLNAQLRLAPSRSIDYLQSTSNTDVTNTWAHGKTNVFFGVSRSDSRTSSTSSKFSQNEISLKGSFGHVMTFSPVPGSWFSSAGTKIAYDNKDTVPPWVSGALKNWTSTFDPQAGTLARFIVSLVVVDTMNITFHSLAKYTDEERNDILKNKSGGVWPFYNTSSDSGISTQMNFNDDNEMTITIASLPGVPIVIGANVFSAKDYLV